MRKRPEWIRSRLMLKRLTVTEAARRLGISRQMLHGVITGTKASRRVRRGMAELLGLKYRTLWGEAEPEGEGRTRKKQPREGKKAVGGMWDEF
jgi:hypothetical protein